MDRRFFLLLPAGLLMLPGRARAQAVVLMQAPLKWVGLPLLQPLAHGDEADDANCTGS